MRSSSQLDDAHSAVHITATVVETLRRAVQARNQLISARLPLARNDSKAAGA